MKRLIALLTVLLLLFGTTAVHAASKVDFSAQQGTAMQNRLIGVAITARGDVTLSAVTFTLRYNKAVISYQKTESGDAVAAHDSNGSCRVNYLCRNGKSLKHGATLFTVVFRAVGEGTSDIAYTAAECTGCNARFLPVGSCDAGRVEVRGTRARFTPLQASRAQSSEPRPGQTGTDPSSRPYPDDTTAETGDGTDDIFVEARDMTLSEAKKEFDSTLPLLITGFSAVVLALLCFWLGQKYRDRRVKKEETKVPRE